MSDEFRTGLWITIVLLLGGPGTVAGIVAVTGALGNFPLTIIAAAGTAVFIAGCLCTAAALTWVAIR